MACLLTSPSVPWRNCATGAIRVALVFLLLAAAAVPLPGREDLEREVKAAMIYNFARFVTWPEAALAGDDPLVIGVVGDAQFGRVLQRLVAGKEVFGHELRVARYKETFPSGCCQILYFGGPATQSWPRREEKLRGRHVLTIGDGKGFAAAGGVIGFLVRDKRVRFEVNVRAARRAGLRISSKMLRLAQLVGEGGDR